MVEWYIWLSVDPPQAPAGPVLQHVPGPAVPRHQQPLQPPRPPAHTQVGGRHTANAKFNVKL